MTNYLIVPGLNNSGRDHWQSYFEKSGNNFHRIIQEEWEVPVRNDWVETIDREVSVYDPTSVVLIGHSLGCAAIASWANEYRKKIKGALLVAPSDIETAHYNFPIVGFDPMPINKINFKTIVVASTNDHWVSIERAKFFAEKWGSEFISIGDAGHINSESGYGEWKEGLEILKRLG